MINLSERKTDKLLNIKTRGTRESKNKQHYRYEATPYKDLFKVFNLIKLNEDDSFIDFGSGRGRVCFLVHHLFKANVLGIEANPLTFDEALINLDTYYEKINNDEKIKFDLTYAEKYEIKDNDNFFFFFNPFTINIFREVISNIIDSVNKHERKIIIILAYPIVEYVSFILEHTNLLVVDYIDASDKNDKMNKFLIISNE